MGRVYHTDPACPSGLSDGDSFLVEVGVFTAEYDHITYVTILLHNEFHYHAALDVILGCHCRIFDVGGHVLEEFCLTAGELRHLLYGRET